MAMLRVVYYLTLEVFKFQPGKSRICLISDIKSEVVSRNHFMF